MTSTGGHNWQKGEKGYRPKLTDSQRHELMAFWVHSDWDTTKGRNFLLNEFNVTMSEKGLYLQKMKLREMYEKRNKQPEEEVDWTDLIAIEVNSNVSSSNRELMQQLYGMWEEIKRTVEENTDVAPIPFTYRKLKWLAFMQIYHGNKVEKTADKTTIASMYSIREMVAEWADSEMQREDLDAWLSYEPWRSDEHMQYYLALIKKGAIPDLEPSKFISSASEFATNTESLDVGSRASIYNLEMFLAIVEATGANKYKLPSEQMENPDTRDLTEYAVRKMSSQEEEPQTEKQEEPKIQEYRYPS